MYLICGANGYLGHYFIKNILTKTNEDIIATGLTVLDNTNGRISWQKCDVAKIEDLISLYEKTKNKKLKVLFLAAYHHPDLVIKNPKIAWNVNVIALANFLGIFDNIETLYYPSTEVVYGEMLDKPFKEDAILNPINRYGELKTIAEKMVNVAGFNIIRFPVLIGPSLSEKKKHFYDLIVESVEKGEEVEMFYDQFRSMIDFDTASKIVIDLIENEWAHQYKIVNVSGDEALSKYELGLRICRSRGLDERKIKPISINADNKIFTAKRANCTLLDNSLVKNILKLNELKIRI